MQGKTDPVTACIADPWVVTIGWKNRSFPFSFLPLMEAPKLTIWPSPPPYNPTHGNITIAGPFFRGRGLREEKEHRLSLFPPPATTMTSFLCAGAGKQARPLSLALSLTLPLPSSNTWWLLPCQGWSLHEEEKESDSALSPLPNPTTVKSTNCASAPPFSLFWLATHTSLAKEQAAGVPSSFFHPIPPSYLTKGWTTELPPSSLSLPMPSCHECLDSSMFD